MDVLSRALGISRGFGWVAACATTLAIACGDPPAGPQDCSVRQESGGWTFLGLTSEWVTALAETPWGLYAGTLNGGVFHFDAATGCWQSEGLKLDRGYISALLYTPTNPPRLLAAIAAKGDIAGTHDTEAAVYASENGGRRWKPWDGGLDARAATRGSDAWAYSIAVDPGDPNQLYMGLSYAITRSDDGGSSWRYILGGDNSGGRGIRAILVDPGRNGRMWAAGSTAFFAGAILRSTDWGTSWAFTDPTPGSDNAVLDIALDPSGSGRLFAATLGGVMVSDDDGATWRYVLRAVSPYSFAHAGYVLYAAASENYRVSAGGQGLTDLGLYRTHDGGQSWDTLTVPTGAGGGRALAVDSQGRLLLGTEVGAAGAGVWRLEPQALALDCHRAIRTLSRLQVLVHPFSCFLSNNGLELGREEKPCAAHSNSPQSCLPVP